ncbi:MAG: hypothetical protein FJ272_07935, partial [Planctomycetes bacterium]|nr:hypothetical protein [Planctomycetota bacterium]
MARVKDVLNEGCYMRKAVRRILLVLPLLLAGLSVSAQDKAAKVAQALEKIRAGAFWGAQAPAMELAQLAPAPTESLPALIAALAEPSMPLRWSAAKALGQMGPAAAEAGPALAKALTTGEWYPQ